MAERTGDQLPVGGRQEHDAGIGQGRDHKLDDLAKELIPVPGGGHKRSRPHEKGQPLPRTVGLGARGAGTGPQFGLFLLGPSLLGQVGEDRICPARPALIIPGIRDRGDPHPAQFAGLPVPKTDDHPGDDLTGPQRYRHWQVFRGERRTVLAHCPSLADNRPRCHRGRIHAQYLAGGRVHTDDRPVGVVVDDTVRHGLEQRPIPLLRRGILGQRVQPIRAVTRERNLDHCTPRCHEPCTPDAILPFPVSAAQTGISG